MAINKRFTQLNNSGSNHNLLDAYTGKVTGSFEVTGAAYFKGGLSGSLTKLVNGSDYLLAGPYITLTTNSLGQIEVSGTSPPAAISYWDSFVNGVIKAQATSSMVEVPYLSASYGAEVSGSAIFAGAGGATVGSDTSFFVSGNVGGLIGGSGVAAFGGDVYVSGNMVVSGIFPGYALDVKGWSTFGTSPTDKALFNGQVSASYGLEVADITSATAVSILAPVTASKGLELSGSSTFAAGSTFTFNGNGVFVAGLTGSLQEVSAGVPYLLAGDYITIATNSLGQIAISASNLPGTEVYWQSDVANNVYTTGSVQITGSVALNAAGTGRGLLRVGGLDIGPITGSLYSGYTTGTETGIINGNILSASNGVWDGTNTVVLRHEVHVLGLGYGASEGGPTQMFAATYLVMSFIDSSGVQSVQAVTELSRETSGSLALGYDINFAANGNIEATGSLDYAFGHIVWYAQRVKEMSLGYTGNRS